MEGIIYGHTSLRIDADGKYTVGETDNKGGSTIWYCPECGEEIFEYDADVERFFKIQLK